MCLPESLWVMVGVVGEGWLSGHPLPICTHSAALLVRCRCQALLLTEALQNDAEAGLDATQQLSAELEHLLMQVRRGLLFSQLRASGYCDSMLQHVGPGMSVKVWDGLLLSQLLRRLWSFRQGCRG